MLTNPNTLGLFETGDRGHRGDRARRRRARVLRRGEPQRDPRAVPARATWASTSCTSTRTRRSRRRTAGEGRAPGRSAWSSSWSPFLPSPTVERAGDGFVAGPRPPALDRPDPRVPRQRRRPGARVRVRVRPRRRRAEGGERARGAERELPGVAGPARPSRRRIRTGRCTSSWPRRAACRTRTASGRWTWRSG